MEGYGGMEVYIYCYLVIGVYILHAMGYDLNCQWHNFLPIEESMQENQFLDFLRQV